MDTVTRSKEIEKNPAALLALSWYFATNGKGEKDMVILPYKDRLLLFSRYLQQLIMESLGKEFGPKGITANLVSPGPTRSDNWDAEQKAHVGGMVARVPVGRLGEPTEVAAAVSLLASEKGAFINGQIIQVNGGAET